MLPAGDVDSWAYLNPYHMLGLASQHPKSHGSSDPGRFGGLPHSSSNAGLTAGNPSPMHPDNPLFWFAATLGLVALGFAGIHGGARVGPASISAKVGT
jgi:hypothetical protein